MSSDPSHPLNRAASSRSLFPAPASLPLSSSLTADSRRALWLPEHKTLVVADLHLGYAWAHRSRGQLLPVSREDDTVSRMLELQEHYQPDQIVLLGDIVHGTASLPEVRTELGKLIGNLSEKSRLRLILGNHDHRLEQVLGSLPAGAEVSRCISLGRFILLHGDDPQVLPADSAGKTIIMGHEHPTLSLGDGITAAARCPCFLYSDTHVVLPAFSSWANGCTVGRQPFLSPLLREASFPQACAILGHRLLRVPLAR